jgi:hypothetical protein
MTDFRALCAELVEDIEEWMDGTDHCPPSSVALVNRARAALAQPEPQGPTDEELGELLYYEFTTSTGHGERVDALEYARAVLARWGRPAVEPVPVAARLPGSGDCDAEGRCWFWNPTQVTLGTPWWSYEPFDWTEDATHWLPHNALPVPQQEAE